MGLVRALTNAVGRRILKSQGAEEESQQSEPEYKTSQASPPFDGPIVPSDGV